MSLDKILRIGVSKIISELFYYDKNKSRQNFTSGDILHYRLGFIGDELYCRFMYLDDYIVKICGSPDRISYENGKLYVDELKTVNSKSYIDFARKVAYVQLQFYMFLTGIRDGRIYIYIKPEDKLILDSVVQYDENFVVSVLKAYLNLINQKKQVVNNYDINSFTKKNRK